MAEPKKRTLRGVYDGLKQISDEEGIDFGIDNYTYEQFAHKYGNKNSLAALHKLLSTISDEESVDFGIGSADEWLNSFNYNNAAQAVDWDSQPTAATQPTATAQQPTQRNMGTPGYVPNRFGLPTQQQPTTPMQVATPPTPQPQQSRRQYDYRPMQGSGSVQTPAAEQPAYRPQAAPKPQQPTYQQAQQQQPIYNTQAETPATPEFRNTQKMYSDAADKAWQKAEQDTKALREAKTKKIEDIYNDEHSTMLGKMAMAQTRATALPIEGMAASLKAHDMEKMANDAWGYVSDDDKEYLIDGFKREIMREAARSGGSGGTMSQEEAEKALREEAERRAKARQYQAMYDKAVAANAPKDVLDFLKRKIVEGNSLSKLAIAAARTIAGTRGDMDARAVATYDYGKGHRVADITGSVLQIATDPVTWAAGGVGKGAVKGATNIAERAAGAAATRRLAATKGGQLAQRMIGGSANFAAFEGLGNIVEQLQQGGVYNEETGQYEYSLKDVAKAAGHGVLLGGATGVVGGLVGNVGDKVFDRVASTAGKLAVRGGQTLTSIAAEGTIFAAPELISGEGDFDTWLESVELMAGFKLQHGLKALPGTMGRLMRVPESRAGFETRLRDLLQGRPDLALTNDEREELERGGYTDLSELAEAYKGIEGKLVRMGDEMPYDRFSQLMADNSISEAARAKMYYYVTGRGMVQSTVTAAEIAEHRDHEGNITDYVVKSYNKDGGVITSRTYKSKKAAEVEFGRLTRQSELNSIDMLEKLYDRLPGTDATTAKMLRDVIGRESGIDIDKVIGKEENRRTDEEKAALQEYLNTMAKECQDAWDRQHVDVNQQRLQPDWQEAYDMGYNADEQQRSDISIEREDNPNDPQAQAAWQGVEDRIRQDVADRADQRRAEGEKMAYKGKGDMQGAIRPLTINEESSERDPETGERKKKTVYLVNGNIAIEPNGNGLSREGTDKTIYVYDPETGDTHELDPFGGAGVLSVGDVVSMEDYLANNEQQSQAEVQQEIDNATGKVNVQPNTPFVTPEGRQGIVKSVEGDNVIVQFADGEMEEASIPLADMQQYADALRRQEYEARHPQQTPAEQPQQPNTATEGQAPTAQAETPTEGGNATAEQPQVEYPRDKQGNIDYDKIGDATTFATALGEEFGEDAPATLDEIIAEETAKMKKQNAVGKARIRKRLAMLEEAKAQLTPSEEAPAEAPTAEGEQPTAQITPQAGEVPDMSVDKASDARARGYRMQSGVRYDRQGATDGVVGSETEVKFTNKEKPVKGRWKVVEAGSVQPSHIGGQNNPLHFITEAQPKDRTDKVSDAESDKIAANINPKEIIDGVTAYTGAPVVNSRGEVIQGNNRATALRKMGGYAESAARYKQYLIDHAADYGLNAEDIAKMQNPVMVREVDVTDKEAIRLGQFTASDTESGGKERISADKVLGKLTDEQTASVLNIMLRGGEETDETLMQLIDRNGADVLTYLAGQGAINDTQVQSAYGRDGRMTPEAKNDLADMVTQNIFKGGADNIKKVWNEYLPVAAQKALLQAMAGDLRLPKNARLIEYVRNAIMAVGEIKNNPFTKEAKTAEDYHKGLDMDARQADMLSRPIKERYSELELYIAVDILLTKKQNAIKAIFGDYQRLFLEKGADLFEAPKEYTPEEAIEKVFGIKLNKTDNNEQGTDTGGSHETGTSETGETAGNGELGRGERQTEGEPGADTGAAEQAAVSKYEEAESAFFGFLEWTNWEYGTKYDWNSLMSFLKWANKKAKAKEQPLRKFVRAWIGDKYPPKDAAELTDKIFAALKEQEEAKKATAQQPKEEAEGRTETAPQPVGGATAQDTAQAIAAAEAETDTNPTEGQKEAGNYKKGHVRIDGYDITIEQPKGSVRRGTDKNGRAWEQEMHNTYGYIRGTESVDGDHIDVFLSDDPTQGNVYVVDQVNEDGTFDEHKVMYGFPDIESARQAYLSNYEDGWRGLGTITPVSKEEFKKWIESSHRKTKPFSEYKGVKTEGDVMVGEGIKPAAEQTEGTAEGEKRDYNKPLKRLAEVKKFMEEIGYNGSMSATMTTVDGRKFVKYRASGNVSPNIYFGETTPRDILQQFYLYNNIMEVYIPADIRAEFEQEDADRKESKDNYWANEREKAKDILTQANIPFVDVIDSERGIRVVFTEKKNDHGNYVDYMDLSDVEQLQEDIESVRAKAESYKQPKQEPKLTDKEQATLDKFNTLTKKAGEIKAAVGQLIGEPTQENYNKATDEVKAKVDALLGEYRGLFSDLRKDDLLTLKQKVWAMLGSAQEQYRQNESKENGNQLNRWANLDTEINKALREHYGDNNLYMGDMVVPFKGEQGENNTEQPKAAVGEKDEQSGKGEKVKNEAAPKQKIDDVGEKIGGARKDLAQKMGAKINLDADTFPKMFPKFDLKKAVEQGLDPKLASSVYFLRIAAQKEYKSWLKRSTKGKALSAAKFFAAYAKQFLENGNTSTDFKDNRWTFTEYGKKHIECNLLLFEKIYEKFGNAMFDLDLAGYEINPIERLKGIKYFRKNEKGNSEEFQPAYEAVAGYSVIRYEEGELDKAIDEVVKRMAESVSYNESHPYKLSHYYMPGEANSHYIGVKLGGKVVALTEKMSDKEASQYLREHEAELQEKAKRLDEERKQSKQGGTNTKWKPELGLGGGRARVGNDYRNGKDVSAEDFRKTFGFRGVEFGNYVTQAERQRFINEAYDAMMDLAALLNVSPRALSLGGRLGFAIGARGGGNAMAHYEPDLNVINLTKSKGAGSLAHEWWHALDYYFNRMGDRRKTPATANRRAEDFNPGQRREMEDAFVSLMEKINGSDYRKRSVALDAALSKDYYTNPTELGARAFQDYVQRRLTDKGQVNDFLSSFTPEEQWNGKAETYPYPTGKDADAIDERFDNLFGTMLEREDEQGNVMLYERADGKTAKVSAKERKLRDAIVDLLRKAGIDVVTESEEGQRVLDMANGRERQHRVYHGSGADFERFDHSHMGEGEGAQAFGWGTYVTEVEGIGRQYAEAMGNKRTYKGKVLESDPYSDNAADRALFYMEQEHGRNNAIKFLKQLAKEEDDETTKNEYFETINVLRDEANWKESGRFIYTVEIPEDNGSNYIDWTKKPGIRAIRRLVAQMNDKQKERIASIPVRKNHDGEEFISKDNIAERILWHINNSGWNNLYDVAEIANGGKYVGNEKSIAKLLNAAGFVGIKYPAEYYSGGRSDGAKNYVIFNESDLQITDKVKFFRTESGEAYGFTMGGKIYLDPKIATAETPIHEYTHLWAAALRQANPKAWERLKSELEKDKDLMAYVQRLYPELKGDELMDEVFAHFSGRRGAERLRAEQERMEGETQSIVGKAKVIAMFENLRDALKRFWNAARELFGGKSEKNESAEDFADMVLGDLVSGFNPRADAGVKLQRSKADEQTKSENFKKWFGDWEKAQRIEKLRKSTPITATGEEYKGKYELNNQGAERYILNELRGEYTNQDTGDKVIISRKGADKVTRHDADNDVHLKSIALIPQMIENAIFIDEDTNTKNVTGFDSYRYYVTEINIGGEDYTAKIVVGVKNGEIYYDHALTQIEKGKLLDSIDPIKRGFADKEQSFNKDNVKDKRLLSILENNSSKVVDEEGKPLVVYHGAYDGGFSIFDKSKRGSATNAKSAKKGFFFTDNRKLGEEYARRSANGKLYEVYLDMKNPLIVDFKGERVDADSELVKLINKAKREGYDGVIAKNLKDGFETNNQYIVFEPTQIKSATENVGTFDGENPDIRYQRADSDVRFRGEEGPPLQTTDENGTHDVVKLTDIDAFTAGAYDKAAVKKLADWLKENKDTYVRLYHGTSSDNTIETEGIRRTNNRNKHSYQSQNGYVYLSIYPSSSRLFGELGSGRNGEDVSVYAVDVKVKDLLPDTDQLNNKRAWGGEEFAEMGNSLAESILYGSGARVKRDILPSETSKTLFRGEEEPVFYSNAMRAVENIKQERATPEQWVKMIEKQGGLKAGEDKWLGLSEWLKGSDAKTLTKGEVLDYIRANEIQIEEVEYGEGNNKYETIADELRGSWNELYDEAYSKVKEKYEVEDESEIEWDWINDEIIGILEERYGADILNHISYDEDGSFEAIDNPINSTRLQYTTEGLDNKREIVLTVPTIEPWNEHDEIHFGEAGGGRAVAWVRFGETTDADGKRVLVIDEIQSKRHQEGRERGYTNKGVIEEYNHRGDMLTKWRKRFIDKYNIEPWKSDEDIIKQLDEYEKEDFINIKRKYEEARDKYQALGSVPDAPFEKNWHEVAMKRMLRFAAENGYDKVAWTKGEQQAERYDLGQVIDKIVFKKETGAPFGEPDRIFYPMKCYKDGELVKEFSPAEENLEELVGRDIANEMKASGFDGENTIEKDLITGNVSGMQGFYDQMLPRFMDKYGKKWGVKTGEVELPNIGDNRLTMWSVDVTDDMRESVMRGQPLFRPKTQSREGGEEANAGEWYDRNSVERIGEFAGYSPKQIAAMNARQEESARNKFRDAAEKLHLSDNITFADTIDDVQGLTDEERKEWRRKKGWYSPRTGKIVIILGNHKSMDDVMKSILHEGVAHHGLRQMFGEHFNTFLDNLYQTASPEIRDRINTMAKKHGWDFREATEEYLAMLAEDTDFERPENQSWWKQVKAWFIDMLHKIGFKLHDAYDTITDNELRYILWRSYENLVNPGRYNSVVEEAKDIAKQYDLKVGQWDETWTIAAEAEPNATIEFNGRRVPIWATNGRRENRADRVEREDRMGSDYNVAADGVAEDAAEYAQRDAEYMEAVNNGDMEKAQRMVDEAAKRAMPDTKIVDENGNPLVVYHGGKGKIIVFDKNRIGENLDYGTMGAGFYFTSDRENAENYARNAKGEEEPSVERVFINIRNIKEVNWNELDGNSKKKSEAFTAKAIAQGYDGLMAYAPNRAWWYVAFDSNQIKSADPVTYDDNGNVIPLSQRFNEGSDDIRFRDGEDEESDSEERESIEQLANNMSIGTSARFAAIAARNAQESHDNAEALAAALNFTSQNLAEIVKATKAQKKFDKATVKQVTDMARVMVSAGYLDSMGRADVKGLLKAIRESTGETDNTDNVNRIIDIMVKNQLKNQENTLATLLKIKGSRVDARGINVQGKLDPNGQQVIKSFKDNMKEQRETIESRIADAEERMTSEDRAIADAAYNEKVGLQLALDYVEKIGQSKADEKDIEAKKRAELSKVYDYTRVVDVDEQGNALFKKDGTERTHEVRHVRAEYKGKISDEKKAERERVEQTAAAMDDAIRHMRMERIDAYTDFIAQVAGNMKESMERAKAFREADKRRVETIHHLANSDMQGRKLKGQDKDTILDNLSNNVGVRIALSPLMNLDQMLRMFGRQNVDGKGNLWNYYMRGWIDAVDGEQTWKERYMDKLNAKVKELFGKHGYNWLEHYSNTKDGMTVQYWDGTKMKEVEMPQSRMLYIYAVEKMPMGKATNRRMGLTDEDIAIIEDRLDPKLKEFVDWAQSELLPEIGRECDKVHMRMFGAHMDSIENYFPFDRDTNAMPREEENGQERKNNKITVLTGAIKKRTPNVVVWDMKSCNIFDVLTRHIEEMSHWANFAELNRDFGTLESYNRFKQQVMAMDTVYGSGKNLWNNFMEVCAIATDAYDPQRGEFDKNASLVLKGVAMGKVALRPFTAIKQILSQPAFWGEANPIYMIEDLASLGLIPWYGIKDKNPENCFMWAWRNMPNFRKRVVSRTTGNFYLQDTEYDKQKLMGKIMEKTKWGMLPNIGVDAWTIAMGSHAVYRTNKDKYIRQGLGEREAERRAIQDAELCFNKSQQSSEGAFMAPMQIDHTVAAGTAMIFRNASTSYTREWLASGRQLKRLVSGEVNAEAMAKQILRARNSAYLDGEISSEELQKVMPLAKRELRTGIVRQSVNHIMFGWVLPWFWRIGGLLPLFLLSGDDDEKKKRWEEAKKQSLFGPVEGFLFGDVQSDVINKLVGFTDKDWEYIGRQNPTLEDLGRIKKELGYDPTAAITDALGLLVGMCSGINPQTIVDWATAIVDKTGGDRALAREGALFAARLLNCPPSQLDQIYFDEIEMTGTEASNYTIDELVDRWAEYKTRNSHMGLMPEKALEKTKKRGYKIIEEKVGNMSDEALAEMYDRSGITGKARVGKVVAERLSEEHGMDLEDSFGRGNALNTKYGKIYAQHRTYIDMAEDITLNAEIKRLTSEKERLESIGAYGKLYNETINKLEDLKDVKNTEIPSYKRNMVNELGNPMSEEVINTQMENIRKARRRVLYPEQAANPTDNVEE